MQADGYGLEGTGVEMHADRVGKEALWLYFHHDMQHCCMNHTVTISRTVILDEKCSHICQI